MLCRNSASPLLLAWNNVTVSQDGVAITRGIEVALGTPKQVFSLIPSIGDNDMFVFNIADCISASNDTCIAERGGVFDSSSSNTYRLTTQSAWNGTYEVTQGSYIYFNDELNVGYGGVVPGYPVFMDQNGYGTFGALPLAANSTFLEALVAADLAPSRAFGLWTGSRSVDNPVDGSLVVGGYDTARVDGSFTSFPTFPDCATCVVVTNITYEYPGGSASLFSNSTEHLQVGLEPYAHILEVPQDIFENFAKVSNGTYSPEFGLIYDPADPLLGNLSVTLQNGYTTTMPADQIFTLPRLYDKAGTYAISNNSVLLSAIQNTSTPGYVPNWGVPFLTMNYLFINYDTNEFKLAPAYRAQYDSSAGALVTPACSGLAPPSTSSTSSPTASPTTPVSPSPTPSPSSNSHTGAIVGGAVGGVAGLALILGLLFFLFRRRKAAPPASTPAPIAPVDKGDRFSAYTSTSPTEVSELPQQGKNSGLVSQWLAKDGNADDEGVMSSTVKRPFEMPTHNF